MLQQMERRKWRERGGKRLLRDLTPAGRPAPRVQVQFFVRRDDSVRPDVGLLNFSRDNLFAMFQKLMNEH